MMRSMRPPPGRNKPILAEKRATAGGNGELAKEKKLPPPELAQAD